jgi:hypothetical protein
MLKTDLFSRKSSIYIQKRFANHFFIFLPDYKIELPNGNRIKFQTLSHWQTYFKMRLENDIMKFIVTEKKKNDL